MRVVGTIPVRVGFVVADDDFRNYLGAVVGRTPGFRCVWSFGKGELALGAVAMSPADVVVVDIYLPGMSGLEFIESARLRQRGCRFLVFASDSQPERVLQFLEAGANGNLEKSCTPSELVDAISSVHAGGAVLTPRVLDAMLQFIRGRGLVNSKLTHRERQVLSCLTHGISTKEIASRLHISVATVRTHVRHILEKEEAHSRTEVIAKYYQPGPFAEPPVQGDSIRPT
jgi:DNA-binding NarL/FixJ family response regulator